MGKFPSFSNYINKNYFDCKVEIDEIFGIFCNSIGKQSIKQILKKEEYNPHYFDSPDYFMLTVIIDDENIIHKIYIT